MQSQTTGEWNRDEMEVEKARSGLYADHLDDNQNITLSSLSYVDYQHSNVLERQLNDKMNRCVLDINLFYFRKHPCWP